MLKRKQYKRPPLIEVFCEFFFEPSADSDWDSLLMSDFYRGLGTERFTPINSSRQTNSPTADRERRLDRGRRNRQPHHRFVSQDGNTTVQAGENLLVLNQLPPYYGWEVFEEEVSRVLTIYLRTWPSPTIESIALHYIDRIDIPGESVEIDDYFRLFPVIPDDLLTCPISNLAMAFEVCGDSEGDILAVAFHQQPNPDPIMNSFRLQWDYIATLPQAADVPSVVRWLRTAHDATSRAFRSSLTDRCERLFEGEN